jgi:hypothetical protein
MALLLLGVLLLGIGVGIAAGTYAGLSIGRDQGFELATDLHTDADALARTPRCLPAEGVVVRPDDSPMLLDSLWAAATGCKCTPGYLCNREDCGSHGR